MSEAALAQARDRGERETRLFITRHALAAEAGDLRLPGPDLPLLPRGLVEAKRLARRLQSAAPSVVYSSDSRRARETGEIIAAACGVPHEIDAALREFDFGEWAGQTYAEIVARDPAAADWFASPGTGTPPGGETLAEAAARVSGLLAELAEAGRDRAVIVGHAGSLCLALAQLLGMPLTAYWRLHLDCAGLTIVNWTAAGPVLERLNDTSHHRATLAHDDSESNVLLNDVEQSGSDVAWR